VSNRIPRIVYRTSAIHEILRDCDCSRSCGFVFCPQTKSHDLGHTSTYLDTNIGLSPQLEMLSLTGQYSVAFVPSSKVAGSIAVVNQQAERILRALQKGNGWRSQLSIWYQKWGEKTVNNVIEDFISLGFLTRLERLETPVVRVPKELTAWLHITERCNLRCSYCYSPHGHLNMSYKVGCDIIHAIVRSAVTHNYRTVRLKYAGGEPLLQASLVFNLHKYARKLAKEMGLSLEGVVLTNATLLTPGIVDEMRANGLRLTISLDGLGHFHNPQRPYEDGQGSFADVIKGIDCAVMGRLVPDISVTVTNRSIEGLPDLVTSVMDRGLPFRLSFCRDDDAVESEEVQASLEDRMIRGMLATYETIERYSPTSSLLASLVDSANLAAPHLYTCGVGRDYLVFDSIGRVAKCQMQIDCPITDVRNPDPLLSIRKDTNGIANISVEEREGCRDCKWRYWCAGGCPLHTYRATGRYDTRSPYCRIYRALFPKVVCLEGIRLLKCEKEIVEAWS
jgi:uncharacterized protein